MSADTLVFDMSSQSEGSPQVFVKKDYLSILDNQNQSYVGNQSVIDTSQLANSNKYMNYREAYIAMPLILTLTGLTPVGGAIATYPAPFTPATSAESADYVMGLKNWYGSMIHSFTLDYNGTTIVQQTPYSGMWNTFKLMTSLSLDDLTTQGSTIGFFPDTSTSVKFNSTADTNAPIGTYNNQNGNFSQVVSGAFASATIGNSGLLSRQTCWTFDPAGVAGNASTFSTLISTANLNLSFKSYIFNKVNGTQTDDGTNITASTSGVLQVAITASVMLKHIHSFFERVPLLKGVFMKLTFNLNQSNVSFTYTAGTGWTNVAVQSPLGGVSPLMLSSGSGVSASSTLNTANYVASVAVGGAVLTTQSSVANVSSSPLSKSIQLVVPAYTFNPVFETSYLSSPVKKIIYTDIYQYQIVNQIQSGTPFNNLITNGIANIKSVLVLPFFTQGAVASGFAQVLIPFQSPFEPTGAGPTSPLCLLGNFNIQVSGQNAIYNTEKYTYEQFINQLYGANAVNGGMTDGLTSGLIGQLDFETCYNYYYVNVGRMLPVEESVPKSVNIVGQNFSNFPINLFIFIEYGVEVSVDILTGARV
jgi:hypothetical protein